MGFFAQFFSWLDSQLADYIGTHSARVASAIEPAAVTLATVYVMIWGYLSLSGRIQEPMWEGVKRIFTVAIVPPLITPSKGWGSGVGTCAGPAGTMTMCVSVAVT